MSIMRFFVVMWFVLLSSFIASGQSTDELSKHIPTTNINKGTRGDMLKHRPKRRNYSFIYKSDAYGILYGNPCALEASRKMGFEYVVQTPGLPGSILQSDVRVNNFLVNLKLIFTRSPFWKLILNKKLRECQQKSGDIVG